MTVHQQETTARHLIFSSIALLAANKAEVKPESTPSLEQIARLLRQDPTLKLKVVGHTDMVGSPDANMKLSQARAEAVVQALVSQHGIAASRLPS